MRRGLEGSHDVGVHHDGELLVCNDLSVPRLNVLEHPVGKRLASQRVHNVDDPLAGEPHVVVLLREIICHLRILAGLLQELLEAEALVLRHREVLDLVAVEELALAVDELLEEVDRVALKGRQVGMALDGEEVVPEDKVS